MTLFIDEKENPDAVKRRLNDNKLMAWDGHVHSFYSRDIKERPEFHPASIFFTGLKRGMSYITITDHDEYTQNEIIFEELSDQPELLRKFIPGTEFTLDDKNLGHVIHVNVYLHTRKDFEKLKTLRNNLMLFVNYCKKKSLMFQYNHPLWFEMSQQKSISEKNFEAVLEYGRFFPVVEISNSNRTLYENLAAEILTKILGKGATSSSDGHFADIGARGYTLARGKNFREFWNNIIKKNAHLVKQNLDAATLRGFALDTVDHLAFPTKIKKVGEKYRMETGNARLGALMSFFDKFPWFLRPIRPYIKNKIRKSHLIEEYLESQDKIGKKAAEYFQTQTIKKIEKVTMQN
jgi:predicted metal-dependent phosphoesterase TrpH